MSNLNYGIDLASGISKRVLFASKYDLPNYEKDTKIYFRYQTRLCDNDHTVLDDNRKDKKPLELIIGKQFKLEVWETCLKSMRPNEVASFIVHASLVSNYPMVAKSLREIRCGSCSTGHHCCGMTIRELGLGHPDLDNLLHNPQPLEFIFEVTSVEDVGKYKKDLWALSDDEKLNIIPMLKEEGNKLFVDKKYEEASEKYGQAIGLLDQLALKEKPGDEEYLEFEMKKIPFLLNYSQCKLYLDDFYSVIKHASEVLEKDPDNVKALFRRGKGHVGAWNPEEARKDLQRAAELDPSLLKAVTKELNHLAEMEKEKKINDQMLLKGKLFA
ncbi:hypothetical protein HELRODRAFT_184898 [Helobdella robusta]|uniref:AIP/AIPL N-terminal FKBP-type PPIase domain-containing protein n=1 Tax=Helobdella robusta TaxID=6412 RepID=T1FM51_HELRO|nr:hypothetical protein HELRODRAFT_184898 [Helobdella robusta]ESO05839.1 hypothetical protein HELRODRAFT_184898 [Helobdella robusta]